MMKLIFQNLAIYLIKLYHILMTMIMFIDYQNVKIIFKRQSDKIAFSTLKITKLMEILTKIIYDLAPISVSSTNTLYKQLTIYMNHVRKNI